MESVDIQRIAYNAYHNSTSSCYFLPLCRRISCNISYGRSFKWNLVLLCSQTGSQHTSLESNLNGIQIHFCHCRRIVHNRQNDIHTIRGCLSRKHQGIRSSSLAITIREIGCSGICFHIWIRTIRCSGTFGMSCYPAGIHFIGSITCCRRFCRFLEVGEVRILRYCQGLHCNRTNPERYISATAVSTNIEVVLGGRVKTTYRCIRSIYCSGWSSLHRRSIIPLRHCNDIPIRCDCIRPAEAKGIQCTVHCHRSFRLLTTCFRLYRHIVDIETIMIRSGVR